MVIDRPLESIKSAPSGEAHISTLDGIRGIAALTVFFHHAIFASVEADLWPRVFGPLIWLSHFGEHGVDLFFTLSGYLITSILIAGKSSPIWFKEFYVKRLTRIMPVYLITLLGLAIFLPGSGKYIFLSLIFIANFARFFKVETVGPFWSLAIEEQFYTLWPLVVRSVSIYRLKQIAFGVVIAEPFIRLAAIATGRHFFIYTVFHCDGLAFGALLACQVFERHVGRQLRNNRNALAAGTALYFLYAVAVEAPIVGPVFDALAYTGTGLITYAIVGLAVAIPRSQKVRWLATPSLVFFGQISYAFYMAHLYIFMAFDQAFGPLDRTSPTYIFARMVTVLIVTSAIGVASRHLVELPAMRLRATLLRNRAAPK